MQYTDPDQLIVAKHGFVKMERAEVKCLRRARGVTKKNKSKNIKIRGVLEKQPISELVGVLQTMDESKHVKQM